MKIFVLNSGGIDSATCLAEMVTTQENKVISLSVNYGQKHSKELESAKKIASYYGVEHHLLDLRTVFAHCQNPLMQNTSLKMPVGDYGKQFVGNPLLTYIPFRNGLLLSAGVSFAMGLEPNKRIMLCYGAHDDVSGKVIYPDCTKDFVRAMNDAIRLGTGGRAEILALFAGKTKADIVRRGIELQVPYELTWSCYEGGETPCGTCGTCIDRQKAFVANSTIDPIYKGSN